MSTKPPAQSDLEALVEALEPINRTLSLNQRGAWTEQPELEEQLKTLQRAITKALDGSILQICSYCGIVTWIGAEEKTNPILSVQRHIKDCPGHPFRGMAFDIHQKKELIARLEERLEKKDKLLQRFMDRAQKAEEKLGVPPPNMLYGAPIG
jgi:hypothetical protein